MNNRRTRALVRARNRRLQRAADIRQGWDAALLWFFGAVPGYSVTPRELLVMLATTRKDR